jgi:hypothetical protein
MSMPSSYSDYQPIRYFGRVPVYATTILTAVFALGVVVVTMLASAQVNPAALLGFSPASFLRGAIWTPVTYAFVSMPSFFTVLALLCFYTWAVEVERYLGRARFLALFALLLLALPALAGLWHTIGGGYPIVGNYELTAAFLVAFATLYPGIEFFGWIPLKWFAFASCAISSLMYFPRHDWFGLSLLWVELAIAFFFIRHLQSGHSSGFAALLERLKPRPKFRVLPPPGSSRRAEGDSDVTSEMDVLLDKIAKSGMSSLTSKERTQLERAREALLKKDRD